MILQPHDYIPLWMTFFIIAAVLFFSAEIGFYFGKRKQQDSRENEEKQTGIILGSSSALLAFMLAFAFSMASSIHTERKMLVLEEANAVGTTWLRAQLITEPIRTEVRNLLREYVDIRIKAANWSSETELKEAITRSENLLDKMWRLVTRLIAAGQVDAISGLFVVSANQVIDLHAKRINAGLQRIPTIVEITLLFMSIVTLGMMGYQSGLNGVRTLVSRVALILAFTSVMVLVIDLDRPGSDLIEVSQEALIDLQATMAEAN